MIKAIIFDLDGVLVDATEWHYHALNEALAVFGFPPIDHADHLARFNGKPTRVKLEMLGITEPLAGIISQLKDKYTTRRIWLETKPDYQKIMLIRSLSHRYQLAVASNARYHSVVDLLVAAHFPMEAFDVLLGAGSVVNPKPAPDLFLKAMQQLELLPAECVVVEDSEPGLQAARASGARVIAVEGYSAVNSALFIAEGLL